MSTTQEYSPLKELAFQHRENVIDAEAVLAELAQAGRRANAGETAFFLTCGWDEVKAREQLRRMASVLTRQAIAGTSAERQASAKEAASAAAIAEKEVPKIDDQIAKLQAKRDGLERDARLSQKRVDEQNDAVKQLRTLVPEHIRTAVNEATRAVAYGIGKQVNEAKCRIQSLGVCLAPHLFDHQPNLYLETLRRSFPDAVTSTTQGRMVSYSLSAAWGGIRSDIENELAELRSQLVKMEAQHAEETSAAELPLNHYAR